MTVRRKREFASFLLSATYVTSLQSTVLTFPQKTGADEGQQPDSLGISDGTDRRGLYKAVKEPLLGFISFALDFICFILSTWVLIFNGNSSWSWLFTAS